MLKPEPTLSIYPVEVDIWAVLHISAASRRKGIEGVRGLATLWEAVEF